MYFNTPLSNFIKLDDTAIQKNKGLDYLSSSSSHYNDLQVLLTTMILKYYLKNGWGVHFDWYRNWFK